MSLREQVNERVWYEDENKTSFVFLVRAPIAFGHSQLVMSISSDTHEEENFKRAADHIGVCIERFRSALMLNLEEWDPLAQYTRTWGRYMKTLVLRASAAEKQGEYKVHLVPCFESHLKSANDLFRARFGGRDEGGLLYWIGQREDLVDHDMSLAHAEKRIESYRLPDLAAILRCSAQPPKSVIKSVRIHSK